MCGCFFGGENMFRFSRIFQKKHQALPFSTALQRCVWNRCNMIELLPAWAPTTELQSKPNCDVLAEMKTLGPEHVLHTVLHFLQFPLHLRHIALHFPGNLPQFLFSLHLGQFLCHILQRCSLVDQGFLQAIIATIALAKEVQINFTQLDTHPRTCGLHKNAQKQEEHHVHEQADCKAVCLHPKQ